MKFQILFLICFLEYVIDVNGTVLNFKATAKLKATIKGCEGDKVKPQPEDSCDNDDSSDDDDSCEDDDSKSDDCDDDSSAKQGDDCDDKKKKAIVKEKPKINKSKDSSVALGKDKCTFILPAVAPSPRDILQVINHLKSQQYGNDLICNVAWSEIEVAKKTAEMSKGYKCEEVTMPVLQLIQKCGFKPEAHTVETEDGYILTIHRIRGDKSGEPVILMNPLLGSTDDFVTPGINCLAYDLSRAGYDVYFGNARGNKYSRKHKCLSPKCAEFWDFSWDEIGRYDVPAIIDYILKLTGRKKLHYIGWSQGTTSFFVMASERPEYNDKIACMHALSPIVYMEHSKSPVFRLLGANTDILYTVANLIGTHELKPKGFISTAAKVVCANNPISNVVCSNFLMIVTGFDAGQTNFTNLPINMGHSPAGSSTKQIFHYGQEVSSGKFRNFDYGKKKNRQVYGCDEPPDYQLHKVTCPVALYHGTEDWLSSNPDVERLKKELPNVVQYYSIDKYNHMDYVWGSNAKEKVNGKVLNLMKKYRLDRNKCDD